MCGLRFLPPPHLVHPHRVFEPPQLCVTAVAEQELLAGDELTHHVRDQYFASQRRQHESWLRLNSVNPYWTTDSFEFDLVNFDAVYDVLICNHRSFAD